MPPTASSAHQTSLLIWSVELNGKEYEVEVFENGHALILDTLAFKNALRGYNRAERFVHRIVSVSPLKALHQTLVDVDFLAYAKIHAFARRLNECEDSESNPITDEENARIETTLIDLFPVGMKPRGAVVNF